jgi:hypothetical protein
VSTEQPEALPTPESAPTDRPIRRPPDSRLSAPASLELSVGDGFKFGCGFIMAGAIGLLVAILALAIGFLLASLLGVPLPLGT